VSDICGVHSVGVSFQILLPLGFERTKQATKRRFLLAVKFHMFVKRFLSEALVALLTGVLVP
jgi:hypothetical protein